MIVLPWTGAPGEASGWLLRLLPLGADAPRLWSTLPVAATVDGETYPPRSAPLLGTPTFGRLSSTLSRRVFDLDVLDAEWELRGALEAGGGALGAELRARSAAAASSTPLRTAVCVGCTDAATAAGRVLTLRFGDPLTRIGDARPRRVDDAAQREFDTADDIFAHAHDRFNGVFGYRDG